MTRVESLVDELTLEEKCRLLHGTADPEGTATGYLPGVERCSIPPLRFVDGPLGVRAAGESATAFPASVALAASWDPDLAREQGAAMGREAREHGQDVLLAPGLNIVRVPHGGRNFEFYSEDPHLTARLGVGSIEGIQSMGVVATAKHYVANNQETNRYAVSAEVPERALREIYLPAFRAAVEEADVGSVMTGYNRVNGTHMSDHRELVTDRLKGEYGFSGFVVSDWWGTETTVGAARAGLDIEMPGDTDPFGDGVDVDTDDLAVELPTNTGADVRFGDALREAVESGDVDEATIDEKVRRLLAIMDRFDVPDGDPADDPEDDVPDAPAHRRLARRIAVDGTVLLENDGTLPLDDEASVALVGPNADTAKLGGGGSSEVTPVVETSPLDGLRERAAAVEFERGVPRIPESSLFDAFADGDDPDDATEADASLDDAVEAAAAADCTVVVVQDDATEGADRDDLRLPGGQAELVERVAEAADRTVVVLRTGGPVELPRTDGVNAVVQSWYAGQADGDALAAVLYGDADPGGRLPVTFGDHEAEYPTTTAERFPGVDDRATYDEGVFVGYRHFEREDIEPRYPFGHGLSYATVAYGDPTVERDGERVVVSVPVTNTADRAGNEVVQVYVREETPTVPRPDRELVGFEKLRLDAGETDTASVQLDREAFAHYDPDDGWTVSPGRYTILVGRSSRDIEAERPVEMA